MPNQEKDDKATSGPSSSSKSSGGYSGYGGMDSPSERGGRGTTGSQSDTKSKGSSSSTKSSGGSSGSSASSTGKSSSTGGGTGRPSGYSSGNSGSNDRDYSGRGGLDSPSESIGRAQPSSQPTKTSIGKGFASAYQDMAKSALGAGVTSVGGGRMSGQTTFRESEQKSMDSLEGMRAQARSALLDTIAGPESAGRYDVVYGGGRFTDFSDHPRQAVTIKSGPNRGKKSTAAGKYQFIEPTWDRIAADLGLPDFSEASQDMAAFELAKRDYKTRTGRDLDTDLVSQDPEKIANIGRALSKTWTSLPGGIEQGIRQDAFVERFNEKFMGGTSAPETQIASLPSGGPLPSSRPGTPQTPAADAQPGYVDPMVVKVDRPTSSPAKPVERFRETYLATPASGPTPVGRPTTQVAEVPAELTVPQKIAAGAIDIGSGFIPVVGTGLGLVNAGLQLTGNQTIGERIVAGMGEGSGVPYQGAGQSGGSDRPRPIGEQLAEADTTVQEPIAPPVARFVNTYLGPKPKDKWARA